MNLPTIDAETAGTRSNFRSDRIFYHSSIAGGEGGWCFAVRGGYTYGPFETKYTANKILCGLIDDFIRSGDTGGR